MKITKYTTISISVLIIYIGFSGLGFKETNFSYWQNWKMFSPNINPSTTSIKYSCINKIKNQDILDTNHWSLFLQKGLNQRILLDLAKTVVKKENRINRDSKDKLIIEEANSKIRKILEKECLKKTNTSLAGYEIFK